MQRTVTVALGVGLAAACAGAHPPPLVAADPMTGAEVVAGAKATIEQWRQAYEVRSADTLDKLYAHDPDVVIVQEGLAHLGWNEVKATLDDRLAHANAVHVRLKDLQITALGATAATAVAAMSREISSGAATVTENGTLSLVLRKAGNDWVITAEHYSYRR